jgi:hypothetical protein
VVLESGFAAVDKLAHVAMVLKASPVSRRPWCCRPVAKIGEEQGRETTEKREGY